MSRDNDPKEIPSATIYTLAVTYTVLVMKEEAEALAQGESSRGVTLPSCLMLWLQSSPQVVSSGLVRPLMAEPCLLSLFSSDESVERQWDIQQASKMR
jgi:hypothetical protein